MFPGTAPRGITGGVTQRLSSSRPAGTRSWNRHPLLAAGIAGAALLLPGVAGILVGLTVPAALGPGDGGAQALAWLLAVVAGVVTTVVTDRLLRRVLPLAVLLRLSLDFPDRAPSRLKVALRAGTLRHVDEQLARVAAHGVEVEGSPSDAAARILELMAALSRYDRRTRGHSERVRAFTDVIASEMHLSRLDRDRLRWAALLHDIGKLHVDVEILNKVGSLDGNEWEAVRAHPHVGARIAAPLLPWLGDWGATIEHHHERWDGLGYPYGCAGREIPLGARIVAVADAFEVMTAARSYKRPMSVAAARAELLKCSGEQFDPRVVRALLQASLTRLRWVVGPATVFASLIPPSARAYGVTQRLGVANVPLVRAGIAAMFAVLTLPAVDVPLGTGEAAEADDRGAAAASAGPASPRGTGDGGGHHVHAATAGWWPWLEVAGVPGLPGFAVPPTDSDTGAGTPTDGANPGETGLPGTDGTPSPDDGGAPTSDGAPPVAPPTADRRGGAGWGDRRNEAASGAVGGDEPKPATAPPGAAISEVARSDSGPGHGDEVSETARSTPKPSAR